MRGVWLPGEGGEATVVAANSWAEMETALRNELPGLGMWPALGGRAVIVAADDPTNTAGLPVNSAAETIADPHNFLIRGCAFVFGIPRDGGDGADTLTPLQIAAIAEHVEFVRAA